MLAACESAKEDLGLTRKAPDEFAVIKRAPLEMPPDYTLRPPKPGAARPQEDSTNDQARQTVFGGAATQEKSVKPADSEEFLLQKTGAENADPSIRTVVDQETNSMEAREKPVAEKLLGLGGKDEQPPASIVDAPAEAERLRKNMEKGKDVTEGETPSIEE